MGDVEEYFRQRRGTGGLTQECFDFWGMDQGEENTRRRLSLAASHHDRVSDGGTLLDVGAGGGLLLELLTRKPRLYVGVDMFEDCFTHVRERAERLQIPFVYLHKPEEVLIEELPRMLRTVSFTACVGVMGRGRYRSLETVAECMESLRDGSRCGYVVLSTTFPDCSVEEWLTRFPAKDVRDLAEQFDFDVQEHGPHELGLWW